LIFFLDEEIDGVMLAKLPFDELRALFPKLKDRVLFTEQRDLLIKEYNNIAQEQSHKEDSLNKCNRQTFDICSESSIATASQDLTDDASSPPPPPTPLCVDMDNEIVGTTSSDC
jgi:hypothetical protein